MAWTTPKTWADDELVTTAVFNQQLPDNLNVLSTHLHDGNAGQGSQALGGTVGLTTVLFADQAASPGTSVLQRNGGFLEYNSAGTIVRLGPDAPQATPALRAGGTTSTTFATGDHTHTPTEQGKQESAQSGTTQIGGVETVAELTASYANQLTSARTPQNNLNSCVIFGGASIASFVNSGTPTLSVDMEVREDTTQLKEVNVQQGLADTGDYDTSVMLDIAYTDEAPGAASQSYNIRTKKSGAGGFQAWVVSQGIHVVEMQTT